MQSHIPALSCSVPHNQTRADTTSHPHTQLGHTYSQLLHITLQTIPLCPGLPLLPCLLPESCRFGEGSGPQESPLPPVDTHTHTHTHTHEQIYVSVTCHLPRPLSFSPLEKTQLSSLLRVGNSQKLAFVPIPPFGDRNLLDFCPGSAPAPQVLEQSPC
ncbi:Hypothetical predicted protein [Marmota monax]|uniref:Uncharacterized protein n=1 Tax=Marmota monax TaxID=9995 RepID=A0A5E4BFG1_MARMO|nr:Hypothetical predicted protein [Marmota monax]